MAWGPTPSERQGCNCVVIYASREGVGRRDGVGAMPYRLDAVDAAARESRDRGKGSYAVEGEQQLLGDGRRRRLVAPDLDAESIIGLDAVPRRPGRPINKAHARLADAVEQHVLARDARG